MTAAAKPLDKGKTTLNCKPDSRWPAPERHGWVNIGSEVTHCSCACHDNGTSPRTEYWTAHERAWGKS